MTNHMSAPGYWARVTGAFAFTLLITALLSLDTGALARLTGSVPPSASTHAVITVYSDYQCPACARFETWLDRLQSDFGAALDFKHAHFPLDSIHPNASLAARAAEAARLQGQFDAMHRLLFSKQHEWADHSEEIARNALHHFAIEIGLDATQFLADIDSSSIRNRVAHDRAAARELGLAGTPSLVLSDDRVIRVPARYSELRDLIELAIGEGEQR